MFTVDYETIYWYGVILTFLIEVSVSGIICGINNEFDLELILGGCILAALFGLLWPIILTFAFIFGIPFICVNKEFHKVVKNFFKKYKN